MFSNHVLINLASFSHILPILFGIYFFKRLDSCNKILVFLCFVHISLELASKVFIQVFKSNTLLLPVVNFTDLVCLSYLLLNELKVKQKAKFIFAFCFTFFAIMFYEQTLIDKGKLVLNAFSGVYVGLVLLILSLLLFYQLVKNITMQSISSKSNFWIASGLLFYCCFNILFYLYFQAFYNSEQSFIIISVLIKAIGILIANILFTFAILTKAKSYRQ